MKKRALILLLTSMLLFPYTSVKAGIEYDSDSDLFHEQANTVQVLSHSNGKIYITNKDIILMARVVYAESKGEPYEGKVAVASVILNRVKDPSFPKSIEGVIKQPSAFSCVRKGEITVLPDETSYKAVMEALAGKDPTNEALFFYNPKIATSTWMKNIEKRNLKTIGNHVFFIAK